MKQSEINDYLLSFFRQENRDPRSFEMTQEAISTRMSSPNISTILDTDSIAFTKYVYDWGLRNVS